FAITEDAFYQGWAEETLPLIKAGKAVFAAEYTDTGVDFQLACQWGKANGVSIIQKDRDLTSFRAVCP
ncbi:MAG: endo alpha-1,4 polygalactosaminidase, partial [Anaerolineaceae bacterium]|nr:endo alpha-1,4 polygalactosaminidase [Anaerolineaceae bacterium]HNZ16585.1 endo alpha-1,4 polygalactosaminidase [Anaerolineaceae bacterium]